MLNDSVALHKRLLGEQRVLCADNTEQLEAVAALVDAGSRVLATVDEIAVAGTSRRRDEPLDPAAKALIERSRDEMDSFLAIQQHILAVEQNLLNERLVRANDELRGAKLWTIVMGGATLLTILLTWLANERQTFLRIRLERSLEERVEDRTRELASANNDLESFSYSVAHDLKSPLRAIEGFASLATLRLKKGLVEAAQPYLVKICDHAARTNKMVTDLLAFSQLGRGALSMVPIDFGRLISVVWSELDFERDQRGSTATLTIESQLPTVHGEEALLHQLLQNLLTNAIKYSTMKEHPLITVGCRIAIMPELTEYGPRPSHSGPREHIFYVRDQGIGFAMSDYGRLFAVFQRLHTDHSDGTGIGLAICKRIVERHGGRIWASSSVGEGTEVCFTLRVVPGRRAVGISQRRNVPVPGPS